MLCFRPPSSFSMALPIKASPHSVDEPLTLNPSGMHRLQEQD